MNENNIPYRIFTKRLSDVQMYLIRKEANPEKTIKYLARKFDATYYFVKKFCDEENLPYKSYKKDKVLESEFFCWEMYNYAIY